MNETAAIEEKMFPESHVKELREENAALRIENKRAHSEVLEKGYLPEGVTRYTTDVEVYINKFPLGGPENFSVSRAAYAKMQSGGRMYGKAWDEVAPYEKHYLEALANLAYKSRGFKAQGDQVSGIDGGFLAPETWNATWFDLLRSFTVFNKLPITLVKVPARVEKLPKITNDVTITYPGENVAPTATQYKFGQSTYSAHKSEALINLSNEMIRDASQLADSILRQSTAAAIAADADLQFINGVGGIGPKGLIPMAVDGTIKMWWPGSSATTDLASSAAHGIPSFLHLSSLRTKVDQLNSSANVTAGQARCSGLIANSRLLKTIHTLSSVAGPWTDAQGRPLWMGGINGGVGNNAAPDAGDTGTGSGSLLGIPWYMSNAVPSNGSDGGGTNTSWIIAGMWERFVWFECLAPTYDATPLSGTSSVGFAADETQVKLIYRYDGGPAQPEAFAVLAGCDLAAA